MTVAAEVPCRDAQLSLLLESSHRCPAEVADQDGRVLLLLEEHKLTVDRGFPACRAAAAVRDGERYVVVGAAGSLDGGQPAGRRRGSRSCPVRAPCHRPSRSWPCCGSSAGACPCPSSPHRACAGRWWRRGCGRPGRPSPAAARCPGRSARPRRGRGRRRAAAVSSVGPQPSAVPARRGGCRRSASGCRAR